MIQIRTLNNFEDNNFKESQVEFLKQDNMLILKEKVYKYNHSKIKNNNLSIIHHEEIKR